MARSVSALRDELFESAKLRGIYDPLTGCFPESERALTCLLCIYAHRRAVAWERVALYDVDSFQSKGVAADLITHPGFFLTEYVLQHRNRSERRIWGEMRADLLYESSDMASVVMFENKIGGGIGYEPTPQSNQLARQLDYLISLKSGHVGSVSLLLISARSLFELDWYRTEFSGALKHNDRYVKAPGSLVMWEDVFEAIVA